LPSSDKSDCWAFGHHGTSGSVIVSHMRFRLAAMSPPGAPAIAAALIAPIDTPATATGW
jgi:hypothetical protein